MVKIPDYLQDEYPFISNYLQYDNLKYHYVDVGTGNPFLMVHGNPTWSFYYRNIIKKFAKTHRCIAVDHIGCGLSSKPNNYEYTLENRISNLETLMLELDLKNITLMVHDWGGAIGLGLATRHPDRFKNIIILNTGAFRSEYIPFRINILKHPFFGKFAVQALNLFAYPATFMTTEKPLSKIAKKGYLFPYNTYKKRRAVYEFVNDIPMSPKYRSYETLLNVEKNLHKLADKNIISFWGLKDFCFNEGFFNKFKEVFPKGEFIGFKDAGHYVIEDKKDEVIERLEKFFEEVK